MSRYIDADGIQYTMLYKENWITNTGVEKQGVWKDDIDKIPTADVVEVVRCKDCKYATYDKSIDRYNCRNWGLYGDENTEADDFCSYGEKKVTGKLEREQTHEIQQ